MFQIAVLGPLAADRLGIVRQCIECRAALGPDAPPCPGFGPGCLILPRACAPREQPGACKRAPGIS
jgi:hypothetical protein